MQGRHWRWPMAPRPLLVLLALCSSRWDVAWAQTVCDYPVEQIVRFRHSDGVALDRGANVYPLTTTSINVGFGTSDVSSIDITNPACQTGGCPVMLRGFNLDRLLPSPDSTLADIFCWFGDDLPCSSISVPIRADELACASPTLPATHGIVQFGIFVLGPSVTPPGTLYIPEGLEMTFFDSSRPPIIHRLVPLASDVVDVPLRVTVVGRNMGPRQGQLVQCLWQGEVQLPPAFSMGTYYPEEQTTGDLESQIDCPGPVSSYTPGQYAHLRITLNGQGAPPPMWSDAPGNEPDDPTAPGGRLVFFDARRKVRLTGHHSTSTVYGDITGGSRLVLDGDNFAPLGDGLACVFATPGRIVGNDTVNESAIVATFISPTRLACDSPPFGLRLGETPVYINTTYNSSLFDMPPDVRRRLRRALDWPHPLLHHVCARARASSPRRRCASSFISSTLTARCLQTSRASSRRTRRSTAGWSPSRAAAGRGTCTKATTPSVGRC